MDVIFVFASVKTSYVNIDNFVLIVKTCIYIDVL